MLIGHTLQVFGFAGPAAIIQRAALRFVTCLAVKGPYVNNGEGEIDGISGAHTELKFPGQVAV